MKIAVACGGTGGHIFPGLATATTLKARGHDVTLWLAGMDIEGTAVKEWDGPVRTVAAQGMPRGFAMFRMLRSAIKLGRAMFACARLMRAERPDALLAMGSYASVPPVLAARTLGVPVVLHEANVIPGRAVRFLSRFASVIGVAFDESRPHLGRRRVVQTGMPLRRALREAPPPAAPRAGGRFTVLVMGGSRGASALNRHVTGALALLKAQGRDVAAIHLAGKADADEVRAAYALAHVPAEVHTFLHDMAGAYARADIAICRAGSSTCAELCHCGVASILVPYPHATNDHQAANARVLERGGAAAVLLEGSLSADSLAGLVRDWQSDPERIERMRMAARRAMMPNADRRLAELVEQAALEGGAS
ncbi:MAG: undecaprenyldiphospho-muramoylpentapeptide beta-N-acetylglucosaminyltransferase [Lentisphaerae bacterium]|nr:undecaprenyldiphospho-muramoylpentapeptide beta-N-acetylglucosaminyltransferase [Lentisphaerota bacterium]